MLVRNYGQDNYLAKRNMVRFGEGQVNILATSDNHAIFENLPGFYSNIANNVDEIFPDKDKSNVLNVGMFAGDWFMDPIRRGYLTNPQKRAGDYQLEFLNLLIKSVKNLVPTFNAFYTPGNHCFDSGDSLLIKYLKKADITAILTASHSSSSASFDLGEDEKKIIKQSYKLKVPDDKDPKKIHEVLVLGVVVPGMGFYNPGMMNNVKVIDDSNNKDADISENDMKMTYNILNRIIKNFKKDNPDGAVVVMSHTGNTISERIANKVKNIDIILNGHDHKDMEKKVKNTRIISLGQNSEFFDALKIHFNDKGRYDNKTEPIKQFKTKDAQIIENDPFTKLIEESFREDKKPLATILTNENITKLSKNATKKDDIREINNHLANFVTDGVLNSIRQIEPDTAVFGVASSAFRQDLPVNKPMTNLQLRDLLNGQTEAMSQVYTGKIKGSDLINIVSKNIQDNIKNNRNTIIQWSGIQIDKKGIKEALESGKTTNEDMAKYIKIKDDNGNYVDINEDSPYKVAIPNYFFLRPKPTFTPLENKFKPLRYKLEKGTASLAKQNLDSDLDTIAPKLTINDMLLDYFKRNNFSIEIDKLENDRIIS